jgi:two-component system chemotaxis response regulator CheY
MAALSAAAWRPIFIDLPQTQANRYLYPAGEKVVQCAHRVTELMDVGKAIRMSTAVQTAGVRSPLAPPSAPARAAPAILVIDDSSLCREMVCAALRAEQFSIDSAVDGQAGLERLEQRRPDVILLDNEMPRMDGLAFLRALRADRRWGKLPVIMLTSTANKELLSEAIALGISGYLLKERFSMPEMVLQVRNALVKSYANRAAAAPSQAAPPPAPKPAPPAPAPVKPPPKPAVKATAKTIGAPNLVTRDKTLAGVSDIASIRALSGVVALVEALAAEAKSSASDLTAVLKQDPFLAARVVQMAAAAGSKARLASVDDAVRIVGIPAVAEMAAKSGMYKTFSTSSADGLDMLRCWQHSLVVADVMGRIVPKSDAVPPGLAHLVGLCHDLGEILLRQKFPNEYAAAADYASQAGEPVTAMLPSVFGLSYAELIEKVLEGLKFPPMVVEPIGQFARHIGYPVDAHTGLLPRALAIADLMAQGMLMTSSEDSQVSPVTQNECRSSLIDGTALNLSEIRADAVSAACRVAELKPDQEAALSRPLIDRSSTMLAYLRPVSMAPLDPLAAALGNMATVEIREHLAKADDLAGFGGVVVVSASAGESLIGEAMRARSLGGRNLPILHLTAQAEFEPGVNERMGVEELAYPLSLTRLAQFISTCGKT